MKVYYWRLKQEGRVLNEGATNSESIRFDDVVPTAITTDIRENVKIFHKLLKKKQMPYEFEYQTYELRWIGK